MDRKVQPHSVTEAVFIMTRRIIDVPANSPLFPSQAEFEKYGYSPAVSAGGLLFISGQVALEPDGSVSDDITEQVDLVFQKTFEVLRWAGLTKDDLVEIYSYHVNLPEHFSQFIAVKEKYLTSSFPAWTALGVEALGLPELKIEMRSIAAFRD